MRCLLTYFLCFSFIYSFGQKDELRRLHPESTNFLKICKEAEKEFKKEGTNKIGLPGNYFDDEYSKFKRWQWFWKDRLLPDGSFPNINDNLKAYTAAQKLSKAFWAGENRTDPSWKLISQTSTTGGYNGMGRTTCIAFHPTDVNTFYVGAPQGGLWKTTNNGQSYTPLTDALPYVAVGSCVVDPVDPNIIYISCGDHSGWWTYSIGVYKSIDGGVNWTPTGLTYSLSQGVAMFKMLIDPFDHNIVYLAASNGVFKTINGGTQWTKIKDGFYSDIAFEPGTSNLYAAQHDYWGSSEIYKTTNKGGTWTQLSNFNMNYNWIRLAVTPANSNILAASNSSDNSLYVSYSKGANLSLKGNMPTQGNGNAENATLFISPNDPNIFYAGYVNIYKSTTGGTNWQQQTLWYGGGGYPEVHADHHNISFSPANKKLIWFNCDGGLYQYNENFENWTDFSNGLAVTQFYRIAISQKDPKFMIGGTQDNGGRKWTPSGNWASTNGGDAMEVAIDPSNDNVIYTTYVNGNLYRSNDKWVNDQYHDISSKIPGGKPNGSWVTPYMIDPNNSSTLIAAYNDVYMTTDKGETWSQISTNLTGSKDNTLDCIQIAASDSKIILCSRGNTLYKTTNKGSSWNTITVPDGSNISSITIHPTNPNIIWLTRSGYSDGQKVYKTINGGTSWTNISASLPNVPVNCMVYEKGTSDAIYIGTDIGVFYRNNALSDWVPYTLGMPNTVTTDLEIQYQNKLIRAATFGRGIWESSLAQPEVVKANILVDNIPLVDTDSLVVCLGQIIQFDPQTSVSGKWAWTGPNGFSSSLRNPQLNIIPESEGNYIVNFTDKYGITTLTTYHLLVITKPQITIVASDSTLCSGQLIQLTANGYNNINWLPNNINSTQIQIKADTISNFSAVAIVNIGCMDTALIQLQIFPKTVLSLFQDKYQICKSDSVLLTGKGKESYNWFLPNETFNTNTILIKPDHDINILLEGIDTNGCRDTIITSVSLYPQPIVQINASSNEICKGDSILLNSSLQGAFHWSTLDTTAIIKIKPTITQDYSLLYTDQNSCNASDTIHIIVHDLPANPSLIQDLNSIKTSSVASNYTWYFKDKIIQTGTFNSIFVDSTGLYTLIISDEFGCTSSNSIFFILTNNNELVQKTGLHITPNPNSGKFSITYNIVNSQSIELIILDESGKIIVRKEQNVSAGINMENISLSNLPKGQYQLCLYLKEGVVCKSFIVGQ